MNANTKLEIAVEIMAAKIAKTSREDNSEEKLKELLKEKTKMYQGDKEIIEKIINVYGKEIKGESYSCNNWRSNRSWKKWNNRLFNKNVYG